MSPTAQVESKRAFILLFLFCFVAPNHAYLTKILDPIPKDSISLACLMIIRNEAENLSKNLPLWGNHFFDAYVIAIDSRTTDNSFQVLHSILPPDTPRYIFEYNFTNFGKARTDVLHAANQHFSTISHVFMIDPDWKPKMSTIQKQDLELDVEAYQFKIWDASDVSVRYANWLALNQPNLSFAYYVHEDFRLPNGLPPFRAKRLDWEVVEVLPEVSWHTHVGHGQGSKASRSHERFYFDLKLLNDEQQDPKYKDSVHTLYYLGLIHCAILEGMPGYQPKYTATKATTINENARLEWTPEMQNHLDQHISFLKRLVDLHYDSLFQEYMFLSLRWLAYTHHYILESKEEAIHWYHACISYDSDRVDCKIELSKLYTFQGKHGAAWEWTKRSLTTREPEKAWTHTYMYDCVTPLQVARAALNKVFVSDYDNVSHIRYSIGFISLHKSKKNCKMLVFELDNILEHLEQGYHLALDKLGKDENVWNNVCTKSTESQNHPECDLLSKLGGELPLSKILNSNV